MVLKRLLMLVVYFIALIGCSPSTLKIQSPSHTSETRLMVGNGRTVWVADVNTFNGNKSRIEKFLGKSLKTIVQNEFSNNGFEVLERQEMPTIMQEYVFSSTMGGNSLKSDFTDAQNTIIVSIVNMQINDKGIWIPIVFSDISYHIETSVEVKMVDNVTGRIQVKTGSAIVTQGYTNLLLFFGDLNANFNTAVELSIRNAITNAIHKL